MADEPTATVQQLAALLNLDAKQIAELSKAKILPAPAGRGVYPLARTVNAYCKHMQEAATATGPQLAAVMNLDARRVQQMAKDGTIPPPTGRGVYARDGSISAYIKTLQKHSAGRDLGTNEMQAARTLLTQHQAAIAELELFEKRGELVSAAAMQKELADAGAILRSRLLGIPSKLGPLVRVADDDLAAMRILEDEILMALEELSGNAKQPGGTTSPAERADGDGGVLGVDEAPAETDPKPVGRRRAAPKRGVKRKPRKVAN